MFKAKLTASLAVFLSLLLIALALALNSGTGEAIPSVFTVNDSTDAGDEDTGDGTCEVTDTDGDCTLRAAIEQTNATNNPDGTTINFDATEFPTGDPGMITLDDSLGA